MTRPRFIDAEQVGRAPLPRRGRGLGALIPSKPAPPVRTLQWRELELALGALRNAEFEYSRGDLDAGGMWMDDARRALGTLALTLAEGPDAEGYARLFETILTPRPSESSSDVRPA